ncbi:MAG: RluA family pseudouridine synthase [Acidobacteriota bacterium]|nr:RluA family pseudouridine synthase [Acidobacteriota bacterium]MDQ7088844.1 RluA family pseudouridine synthase [Acidobacteriota bacterium]
MSGVAHRHRVEAPEAKLRLDRFLALRHPEVSRSRLAALVKAGAVRVDGAVCRKPSEPLCEGMDVQVVIPELVEERLEPEAIALEVIHEDDDLLVLNKPAGLVVHPGAGVRQGTLAAALLYRDPGLAGIGGAGRCGLVHRLDRGTSGLMVVARNDQAHRRLSAAFRRREVEKVYDAVVWGRPREAEGEIERPIGRDPRNRVKMAVDVPRGRHALSRYRVREEVPGFALVAVRILTGRTHQVRVHLAAIGHPLVGDATYGGERSRSVVDPLRRKAVRTLGRPALHARRLAFTHPTTGRRLAFVCAWPEDLEALWTALGGRPNR